MVQEVHKQMGYPDWKPNSNYPIPVLGHCSDCVEKYSAELIKLYSKITVCDLCGLKDGAQYREFTWGNSDFYIPETLNEIFKRCGRASPFLSNPASATLGIPTLAFCPDCWRKFTDVFVAIIKQNPD